MLLAALALIAEPAPPPIQPMFVEISRDPITDHVKAFAIQQDGMNRISVGCDPTRFDGLRVTLTSNRWLGRGEAFVGARGLTYRFDDAPPRRMLWLVDDRSARIARRSNARRFVAWLASSERLVIRGRDVEENRLTITIRLTDVREPLLRVLEACGAERTREEAFPDA